MRISARLWLENMELLIQKARRRRLRKIIEIAITDLDLMNRFVDLTSSARFEHEHLKEARPFKSRPDLYRYLVNELDAGDGLHLEFGVYKGDSINRLAALNPKLHWYGFDSFVGLPEMWTLGARKGAFDVAGKLPAVRDNVTLIKGFFEETLPPFVAQHRGAKVSMVNIDCDLYSATRTVLQSLKPMLQPNTIIVFDELINYPGWQDGEYKAFMEFVREEQLAFAYVGYVRTGSQVAIKLL
jgi:hypothetical protein